MHIDHAQWGCLGIIAVYAPNVESERARLWKDLFSILDNSRPLLLTSDLNMIDNPSDHMGSTPNVISGSEKRVWNHFLRHLHCLILSILLRASIPFNIAGTIKNLLGMFPIFHNKRSLEKLVEGLIGATYHNLLPSLSCRPNPLYS